jgi:hypothetical protein
MTTPLVTQETIDSVLDRVPNLTSTGFERPTVPGFGARREDLRRSLTEIFACVSLLSSVTPSPTYSALSYRLARGAEEAFEAIGAPIHVTNGILLLAAYLCGIEPRSIDGLNALLPLHPSYLRGPRGGLPYRPAFTEDDMRDVDSLTARIEAADPRRNRGGASALKITPKGLSVEDTAAALHRLEGICGSSGRYLIRSVDRIHRRWTVGYASADLRPLRLAGRLHLRALETQLAETIAALTCRAEHTSQAEVTAPASEEFRRAAADIERALAELVASCASS